MKKHLPALNCLTGLLGVLLLVAPQDCLAATVVLDPTITSNVELTEGSFELADSSFLLITQQILWNDPNIPSVDKRSILEFPLASVPSGSAITAATLELDVGVFTSSPDVFPVVPVFGYAGDGVAEVNDAAVTANFLGASNPITDLGMISIDLDVEFITGLVDNSTTHLGLLLMGSANRKQAGFDNFNPADKPVLNITLLTPGDFNLDGDVDGNDFLKWQRGESPDPLSASDLLDWQNNYGTTATLAAITSVPEPTTLCFVLLGALGLLANRQTCGYFSSRLPL